MSAVEHKYDFLWRAGAQVDAVGLDQPEHGARVAKDTGVEVEVLKIL